MGQAEIIGLGRSGIAAARLLKQNGWQVTLGDSASEEQIQSRSNSRELQSAKLKLEAEGIQVKLGYTPNLDSEIRPQLIVVSPGVPWDIPLLVEARNKSIDTIGELELAWRYLKSVPWLGVTGTNGKTTTTALIAAIFKAAGLNAPACGNIGYAACELALARQTPDWVIAEMSSYQIESSRELKPQIGIWTTFSPDHLSRHKTLENYREIKASLLRRCPQQILNGDDANLKPLDRTQWQNAYWTHVNGLQEKREREVYIQDSWVVAFGELILPISLFKMPGIHNQQNLLMAVAAARLAGVDKKAIADAITTFSGVPHRLEYICTKNRVKYINDSKATNYDAAEVGLSSVEAPTILIAGGQAKQGDDTAWIAQIKAKAVAVLLIGDDAPLFAQRLQESDYENYEIVETLENAVNRSVYLAREKNAKVVLLSPACASFDQYLSFEDRGEHFRTLCQELRGYEV
ncbi:UDP-N-acetylmuramoylalanine--D-glutamate ligase [Hyella patelloides LEGE 07179]|uniref:UDP-N-acetylmuramoylalanine--D-glutamate ligase n=1 Tax=Hyella patelloides LEGE 07179 TaxID=945734 RepID=A0A563VQ50_9CYAN|nr:UDP-N-acetylmuramoyl-L-alanine--D-glutamate ligase [Hyella patelloides]VEP13592.1 UDP-N-acetylmuramoylalanine--D-glutamate ligase [Hyella patelloides LEGE 07179]